LKYSLSDLLSADFPAVAVNDQAGQGHLRLAFEVQPAKLEGRPQVGAQKRQGAADADLVALGLSRQRVQQLRVVLVGIGRAFAKLGVFRGVH